MSREAMRDAVHHRPYSATCTREIPPSHRDLVECPPVAALTTVTPDGYPQTSVVWCDFDGECVRVNTMRGFAKERNMRRNPRVTLLCYDPRQPLRYLEVRGTVVEMTEAGAAEHLDELASKYAGRPIRYFGDAIPARFAETEIPVAVPDPADPRRRPRRDRPGRRAMTAAVALRDAADPGLAPRPPDPADLRRAHHDGRRRPAPVEPGVGRLRRRMRPGQHDARAPEGPQPARQPEGQPARRRSREHGRFIQIRGDAELVTDGAVEHLDALTRSYTRHPAFYGFIYPVEQRARETRVICRIHARRITLDAIHA